MNNIRESIRENKSKITQLGIKHGMLNPRLFGSILEENTTPNDVDILVKAKEGSSYFDLVRYWYALEELLGCKVDVLTEEGLSPYLKDQILKSAKPL